MPIVALVLMCVGGAGLLTSLILFFTSAAWEDPRLERQMMGDLSHRTIYSQHRYRLLADTLDQPVGTVRLPLSNCQAGWAVNHSCVVGVGGFEPPTSWSQTMRATHCATPRLTKYSNAVIKGQSES